MSTRNIWDISTSREVKNKHKVHPSKMAVNKASFQPNQRKRSILIQSSMQSLSK